MYHCLVAMSGAVVWCQSVSCGPGAQVIRLSRGRSIPWRLTHCSLFERGCVGDDDDPQRTYLSYAAWAHRASQTQTVTNIHTQQHPTPIHTWIISSLIATHTHPFTMYRYVILWCFHHTLFLEWSNASILMSYTMVPFLSWCSHSAFIYYSYYDLVTTGYRLTDDRHHNHVASTFPFDHCIFHHGVQQ